MKCADFKDIDKRLWNKYFVLKPKENIKTTLF